MRKTRLVIQPTRCINTFGFLLLFLSCPVFGDWGLVQPESAMVQRSIRVEREGSYLNAPRESRLMESKLKGIISDQRKLAFDGKTTNMEFSAMSRQRQIDERRTRMNSAPDRVRFEKTIAVRGRQSARDSERLETRLKMMVRNQRADERRSISERRFSSVERQQRRVALDQRIGKRDLHNRMLKINNDPDRNDRRMRVRDASQKGDHRETRNYGFAYKGWNSSGIVVECVIGAVALYLTTRFANKKNYVD